MIILTIIYSLIILYIIGRGLYISIKSLGNIQNRESLQDSISLSALPFYINQGKINLFAFFINFILISLISLTLLPDLISNSIVYCMDNNEEENQSYLFSKKDELFNKKTQFYIASKGYNNLGKWGQIKQQYFIYDYSYNFTKGLSYPSPLASCIFDSYNISNQNNPFIFHLNYENAKINDFNKIFEGLMIDFDDILEKQKKLIQEIDNFKFKRKMDINDIEYTFKNIYEKNNNLLYLTSNSFNKMNPLTILINDTLVENFHLKATDTFNILEKTKYISKENYTILKENHIKNKISLIKSINIPKEEIIQIKNSNKLHNYCNENLLKNRNLDIDFINKKINSFYNSFNFDDNIKYDPEEYNSKCLSLKALQDMGFNPKFNFDSKEISTILKKDPSFYKYNSKDYSYKYECDSLDSIEKNNMGWD